MFDFRRITLFCLEKRRSKHKMTIFSENYGGHDPFGSPWLRLCLNSVRITTLCGRDDNKSTSREYRLACSASSCYFALSDVTFQFPAYSEIASPSSTLRCPISPSQIRSGRNMEPPFMCS